MDPASSRLVYCTWTHRSLLPPGIRERFRDLDSLMRNLLASAESRLVIVAPYLSPSGMSWLRGPIARSVQRGAWVRLVTSSLDDRTGPNFQAVHTLIDGEEGAIVRTRLRLLSPVSDLPAFFHAKLILADRKRGYLGSANMSRSAMEKNFELGIALTVGQVEALDALVTLFEAERVLIDCTDSTIGGL